MLTDILVALWAIYGAAYYLCFKDRTEQLSHEYFEACVRPGPQIQSTPAARPKHPARTISFED